MFVVIAVLCLVAGAVNYIHEEAFFATAEEDTATLVKYVPDPTHKTATFCPKYEFTTKAGKVISYVGEGCTSSPDAAALGQQEKVYIDPKVDPRLPQSVETKGWTGSEGTGLIMGAAGFVFFSLIGLVSYAVNIRRLRTPRRQ